MTNKFNINDLVNVEESEEFKLYFNHNPWKVLGIQTDYKGNIYYEVISETHVKSESNYKKEYFYECKLEKYNKQEIILPQQYLKLMESQISLDFSDVSIKQEKNICLSRLDANIKSEFCRGTFLEIPLIASNMSTVVNADFCIKLRQLGSLGIMHRALNEDDYLSEVKKISDNCDLVAVSIGVGNDQFDLCKKLISCGANIITIDIAHGYSQPVIDLGKKIKAEFKDIKLIVGNTINSNMMYEVNDFADAVKAGVAQGLVCETKNTAGCTEKQFSAILKFKEIAKILGLPIISDGGIREPADFTKSIAAGANSVMAGSIFCRCPESSADIIEINGIRKKVYSGMASRKVQEQWRCGLKKGTCPEGKAIYLDLGEPLDNLLERYSGALRSGITYSGANDIESLQKNVNFIRFK